MPAILLAIGLAVLILEMPRHSIPKPPTDCPDCRPAIRAASVA
jgi:hypothetical protein